MKLAFSTLGCPNFDLEDVARAAREYGYAAVELRALGRSLDLLSRAEFHPSEIARTRDWLIEQGVAVCCVDTSCSFDSVDDDERLRQVELAVSHCELAAALGSRLIRVFPDKVPQGSSYEETRDRIAESLRSVALRAPEGVRVGLETHGDFASGRASADIIRSADHPNLYIIWDAANSFAAGEPIEDSAAAVAPYLAHVHLRDARPEGGEHWTPVLAGRGLVPFAEVVAALQGLRYDGFVSFEWEKYWHPEIEDPEVSLPDFAGAMRKILGEAFVPQFWKVI
ncbi:MAG TPA: sugar phosphate isomerase/epimerase family protein [Pyrinomonadaceae bacterium]|nr:sugar phosphate isomerase/epimerase family protein [Pyrinomonadaceae bacterium]